MKPRYTCDVRDPALLIQCFYIRIHSSLFSKRNSHHAPGFLFRKYARVMHTVLFLSDKGRAGFRPVRSFSTEASLLSADTRYPACCNTFCIKRSGISGLFRNAERSSYLDFISGKQRLLILFLWYSPRLCRYIQSQPDPILLDCQCAQYDRRALLCRTTRIHSSAHHRIPSGAAARSCSKEFCCAARR